MQTFEIKHRWNWKTIASAEAGTLKEAVEKLVKKKAYLGGAHLGGADLDGADLGGVHLGGAKNIMFHQFPNPSIFTQFDLDTLPDNLTLELMRRDAEAHPYPEKFDQWAKGGGCPYLNVDRYFLFNVKKELWKPGPPEMKTSDLILELCKHLNWKIKGYLD